MFTIMSSSDTVMSSFMNYKNITREKLCFGTGRTEHQNTISKMTPMTPMNTAKPDPNKMSLFHQDQIMPATHAQAASTFRLVNKHALAIVDCQSQSPLLSRTFDQFHLISVGLAISSHLRVNQVVKTSRRKFQIIKLRRKSRIE